MFCDIQAAGSGKVTEGLTAMHDCQDADESELAWGTSDLATAGITFCDSVGSVVVRNGWATIGTLLIARPGAIEIVPRSGIFEAQRARLIAVAVQVWLFGRYCLEGWRHRADTGWFVEIEMPYSDDEARLRAFSSARCSSEVTAPRVLAGLSRPSAR